jgi:alpha-L-rhamnosidase
MNNWTVPRRSSRIRTDRWGQTEATPLLRREFSAGGSIKSAVVSVCGLGFYELRLNGARVGDRVMDPAFTHYGKRALYATHDVTALLREGANALGLILGNGWYSPPNYDWFDFDIAPWRGPPKARLQLRIEYADGQVEWVLSDGGWKAARSPVVCDGIRNGELYDARLEQPGWDAPGFDDSVWKPAKAVAAPEGRLVEMKMPPERVVEVLEAADIRETDQHTFVYTFPKNVSGWPRLRVSGPRGTRVTMRCYEVDDNRHDGHLTREGPFQTDTYILKGEGVETYEPRFAYHGFQFVELTGYPGEPDRESLKAAVVHTDFDSAGSFACSLPVFNSLQAMTRNSYLGNYHGFPTDCPTREKGGWTADAYLAAETGLLNFDSLSAYSKWLDDILDCQHADGRVPDIVPTASWGYNGFFDWDCVIIYLPWYVYVYTGDREPMERTYEGMKRCYEHYFAKAKNGILDDGRGDWCPETTVTPKAVTTTAMLADCARLLARMADLLGRAEDAAFYKERAATVAAAFVREFVKDDGTVANGSQTAQSCALYFNLVPQDRRAAVLSKLVDAVKAAKDHLDVGIFGAKYLFSVLSENGHHDLACEIVSNKSYPGYGWWADQGFTTLPESWSCDNSLNHIMFGDISAWFYRHLAGIQPLEESPGFRKFLIRPRPWQGLDHAGAEHQSPRGRIASSWKRAGEKIEYRIEVPEGTEARVVLDGRDGRFETTVGPGKHTFLK